MGDLIPAEALPPTPKFLSQLERKVRAADDAWPLDPTIILALIERIRSLEGEVEDWKCAYRSAVRSLENCGKSPSLEVRDMRNNTWILCGGCERILDGIPLADARISTDGLMMIREAGWQWEGISWECDGCVAGPDEQERAFLDSGASQDRD